MTKPQSKSDELEKIEELLREMFIKVGVKLTEIGWELSEEQVQETAQSLQNLLASQPKPDIKWPEKRDIGGYMGKRHSLNQGWNNGIDACIEAVELAYGAGKRSHNIKLRKGKTVA